MSGNKQTIRQVRVESEPKIVTVKQLANMTGKEVGSIYGLTAQLSKKTGEAYLDVCYPFPDSAETPNTGPVFIVLNHKASKYIEKWKKKKDLKKYDADYSLPKPKHSQIKKEDKSIAPYIKQLFIEQLGRSVQFDASTTTLAEKAEKEYGRHGIRDAVMNIQDSAHQKNNYKLITLNFFFRELGKWSKNN